MGANRSQLKSCELSVVIPVYNSESIFPELHKRLVNVLEQKLKSFEIIAVVDGSRDRSWEVIRAIGATDERVKAIEFSRNFGHQAAITAGSGLPVCRGIRFGSTSRWRRTRFFPSRTVP